MFANHMSKHDIPDNVPIDRLSELSQSDRSDCISYYMKKFPFKHFSHILAKCDKLKYIREQKKKQTLKYCCVRLYGPPYRCFEYVDKECYIKWRQYSVGI